MLNRVAWAVVLLMLAAGVGEGLRREPSQPREASRVIPAAAENSRGTPFPLVKGRVVAVLDGDTVTVLDESNAQHRIRFFGIDAPEKAQPFGQASKRSLSDFLFRAEVTVEIRDRDRYGREVGRVLVNGRDANLEQVQNGMAWAYRQYLKGALRGAYIAAEDVARGEKRGLWADPNPTPPWEWRRGER